MIRKRLGITPIQNLLGIKFENCGNKFFPISELSKIQTITIDTAPTVPNIADRELVRTVKNAKNRIPMSPVVTKPNAKDIKSRIVSLRKK